MDEKITIKPKGSLSLNKQRPELPIDGLPASIQNYINAVCNIYHCPREFVTTAVLATASTAIGKKVVVNEGIYKNPLVLWFVSVARSGSNKSYPMKLVTQPLRRIEKVAYAAHSVSGKGYFVVIPLRYPLLHKAQFEQLVRVFADMGIYIDKACGDVCRLRCQSYDKHPYINLDAKPFSGIYREPKKPRQWRQCGYAENDVEEKVARLCREVAMRHIDLTANYEDWVKIGAALSSLGESGRQWFHLCSSQNSGYNPVECDRKYNNLLHSTRKIGIGTFFYYCRLYGIE
ncbi:MAG: DUF3987 domain-containing protein [Muribaculaceae bacterium]